MELRRNSLNSATSPNHKTQEIDVSSKNKSNMNLDSGFQETTVKSIPRSTITISVECQDTTHSPPPNASNLAKWKRLIQFVCLSYIFLSLILLVYLGYTFSLRVSASIPYMDDPSRLMLLLGSVAVDNTDSQWRFFTAFTPPLIPLFAIIIALSRQIRKRGLTALQYFHISLGLIFLACLQGPAFCAPIAVTWLNYIFTVKCIRYHVSYRIFMTLMWTFQAGFLLFANSSYSTSITDQIVPLLPIEWPQRLRWSVVFNMSTLRMIAFNMDMYEAFHDGAALQEKAVQKHDTVCVECAQMRESNPNRGEGTHTARCYKFRTEYPCQLRDYNLLSYMTYILYVPLYIAGPMSSFNAFVSHLHYPTTVMTRKQMLFYAFRIFVLYLVLTILLHYIFVNGIRLVDFILVYAGAFTVFTMLYFQLAFLWLKFGCIWKLSRLLAILDGVDVPEDMRRCFGNTVTIQDFWRDWHASFNLWIVRYMYIPMGGNKKKHLNIFPIFFFIAIWHDIEPHLFFWALSICVFLVLEIFFLRCVPTHPRVSALRKRSPVLYIILRSFSGGLSHMAVMIACIVGFNSQTLMQTSAAGVVDYYFTLFFNIQPLFLPWFFLFLCCCSHIGLAIRDNEAERTQLERVRLGIIHGVKVSKSEQA
ncbi:glycerol uptake protein [Trypanosoma theileri]|uniref:Glycerol uptake protein n=1 Tax=Trypanosoma theileri TaxID=67003 RepID=A0A1X0P718_9TRYP|nr:glycerol uptake protein [Trypanosoma theileri]ORC92379.1 glycerol uptake protein [Trypanosoma theileri]